MSGSRGKDDDGGDGAGKKIIKRRRRKKSTSENGEGADASEMASPIPRRKRRKLNTPETSKSSAKAPPASQADDAVEDSADDLQPIESMKLAGSKSPKEEDNGEKSPAAAAKDDIDGDAHEKKGSIFLDVQYWKDEREKLDGSFMAARALFTKHGPWDLPEVSTERKFRLIAKSTLAKMDR